MGIWNRERGSECVCACACVRVCVCTCACVCVCFGCNKCFPAIGAQCRYEADATYGVITSAEGNGVLLSSTLVAVPALQDVLIWCTKTSTTVRPGMERDNTGTFVLALAFTHPHSHSHSCSLTSLLKHTLTYTLTCTVSALTALLNCACVAAAPL